MVNRFKSKIKKGDEVTILVGKDRGRSGKVVKVLPMQGKVAVEGINTFKRHVRKMGSLEGGIIDIIKPVNISNVALICPNCRKPVRVSYMIEAQLKKRICKRCKKVIEVKGGKASK